MSVTIRDILASELCQALFEDYTVPGTSLKPWTKAFPPVEKYTSCPPTTLALDTMFHPLDDFDHMRLGWSCHPMNEIMEVHRSEGDTVASWHTQVALPVRLAFSQEPCLICRREPAPLNTTSASFSTSASSPTLNPVIIDFSFNLMHKGQEVAVLAGDLKRCGIINADKWRSADLGSRAIKLGRELRGYAYKYRTPQVFCYDGKHFLLLQFRAKTWDDIKSPKCPVDCMIIDRETESDNNQCTIREALYRIISQSVRRTVAQLSDPLAIQRYPRRFEFHSGRPYWQTGTGSVNQHPLGWQRFYDSDNRQFIWTDKNVKISDTIQLQ